MRRTGYPRRHSGVVLAVLFAVLSAITPSRSPAHAARSPETLVLYDTTGPWGHLGELYAMYAGNLASHFGPWHAHPVSEYESGEIAAARAVIYIGSTYDEPMPDAFLDDANASTTPLIWIADNIWQLTSRHDDFASTHGWMWSGFDASPVATVRYKDVDLTRDLANSVMMTYSTLDEKVEQIGVARRADGTTFPWAVRSGAFTYVGEIPFAYTGTTDRVLIFADMLFDLLAPETAERHRALVRLEDINSLTDPDQLRAVVDQLAADGVPFGFGLVPLYVDPNGALTGGDPVSIPVGQKPELVDALRYAISKGGVLIDHGYTHQHSNVPNPWNAVTRYDFEFYEAISDAGGYTTLTGPVSDDSPEWAASRLESADATLTAAGLRPASIFEFPHYAASAVDYAAVADRYETRWERSLYFKGLLSGGAIDHSQFIGQMFPYDVHDVYGTHVLPENLGSYDPPEDDDGVTPGPTHTVDEIVEAAAANLVVRDGFASFFFHPWKDPDALHEIVTRIKGLGYEFVRPATLIETDAPAGTAITPGALVQTGTTASIGWTASDAGSGVGSFDVRYRRAPYNAGFGSATTWQTATGASTQPFALPSGWTYCFSALARDGVGNVGTWSAESCRVAPLRQSQLSRSGAWSTAKSTAYFGGTAAVSTTPGASLSRSGAHVRRIHLVASRCRSCGTVDVYFNGTRLGRVSLASTTTTHREVLSVALFSSVRTGTVKIVNVSSKRVIVEGLSLSAV